MMRQTNDATRNLTLALSRERSSLTRQPTQGVGFHWVYGKETIFR
jgi:hypothetical protein